MSDQPKEPAQRKCFVVGPIGAAGTPEHDRADWLLEFIIKEALVGEPFNFIVERAEEGREDNGADANGLSIAFVQWVGKGRHRGLR